MKLYSYMQRNLAEDQTLFEVYRSGRAAFAFFDKYQDSSSITTAEARQSFKTEFEGIDKALVDRIGREETMLYPLYQPS